MRLEPLRNFTVVKDLAVELTSFFDKWKQAKRFFEPGPAPVDFTRVRPGDSLLDRQERHYNDANLTLWPNPHSLNIEGRIV